MTGLAGALWVWSILSATELVLDGVIVADNPADSVALVRRAEAERASILRVGEAVHGYVLAEVAKNFVRFEGAEGEFRLFLLGSPPEEVTRGREDRVPAKEEDAVWIRRAFPREVARERFAKEIPVILADTSLEPCVEEGEVRGLSVARLPDGTLLSESGLLPGDVLVSINGEPLRDVDSLWELIARIVDKDEIRVVVRRRDQVLKLAYAFTK